MSTTDPLRLLCVLAHPDDESLGTGGVLAKYAEEGIETFLVTATRGEQGWFGPPDENPGPEELGRIRERELRDAAAVLGLREVNFLDYVDGEAHDADPAAMLDKVVGHIRRIRPHVVVTFDQNGVYGHPDHIALCQVATAAVHAAANAGYTDRAKQPPHAVSKLYYRVWRQEESDAYEAAFGDLVMQIDGEERRSVTWPAWAITTWVDTADNWERVWQAISCHRTQLPNYQKLHDLPPEHHRNLWGCQTYYRVFSVVNGGPAIERDLFEGLRETAQISDGS